MIDDMDDDLGAEERRAAKYTKDQLTGMKIAHGRDAFEAVGEGEMMILTLADAPLLKDDGLNEEADQLEASKLVEREKQHKKDDLKKKKPRYDDYEAKKSLLGKVH